MLPDRIYVDEVIFHVFGDYSECSCAGRPC